MPHAIKDEFTRKVKLGKLSRQRAYQLRHYRDGLCIKCSGVAVVGRHCLEHAKREVQRDRARKGCTGEHWRKTKAAEKAYAIPKMRHLARK